MIRKTLVLGILALVALAVAAPALVGFYLQREFDDVVARLQRPGVTEVVSSDFSRGWFRSRARIRLRLAPGLCERSRCPVITLDSTVHHGPLAFGAPRADEDSLRPALAVVVTRVDPQALWPRLVFEPELPRVTAVTRVGFDGIARIRLAGDDASVDVSRKQRLAHVEFAAFDARARLPLTTGTPQLGLDWPQLQVVGEHGGQLGWRGLKVDVHGRPGSERPAAGGQLRAESITLADGLGTALRANGLLAQWQPLPNAGPASSARFDARISRLMSGDDEAYGPLMLQGRVQRLDFGALERLRETLSAAPRNADGEADDAPAPLLRRTLDGEGWQALLADRPTLDLERLLLTTPDGDIAGHLRLAVPAGHDAATTLGDLLAALDVDVELRLPAAITRDLAIQAMLANGRAPAELTEADVDKAMAELVKRGWIVARPADDAYGLRLQAASGAVTLNGRAQGDWAQLFARLQAVRERL